MTPRAAFHVSFLMSVVTAGALRGEMWNTGVGEKVEGTLSGVYGASAVIAGKTGSARMPLETMDDAALGRVADFLAAKSGSVGAWGTSTSRVAKSLRNRLQVLREGKLVAYEPGARPEPEVYLVYFGARWCGPCRRFSPELVQAYQKLKKIAPERFELVFISSDNDDDEQVRYVREVGMPWPVLKYSSVGRVEPLEKWKGNGIPCLVAVTREGDVLYHSYRGTEYLGPSVVLRHVEEMLGAAAGGDDATKRGTHRLEVLQHVRKAAGATAMAKPHLIVFDPRRYRTLTEKLIHATLAIDARGRVTAASFEPALPTVLEFQLQQDAATWLFLPALENGQPKDVRVVLPLQL
jgi:thiol-disulfide isomerase/thioredoxin